MTPLIMAASRGYTKCVKLLLEAGADQDVVLPAKYYKPHEATAYLRASTVEIKANDFPAS